MIDEVGQSKFFENYGLYLTLEAQSQSTPGLVKRVFKLIQKTDDLIDSGLPSAEERQIIHMQTTRWEDDCAITDKSHFEDLDKMIKSIKKHRGEPS